jgi:hypothetical protein
MGSGTVNDVESCNYAAIIPAFKRQQQHLMPACAAAQLEMKFLIGAAGGDRTHDPWLRRPILYPLSYSRNAAKSLNTC